MEVALIPSPSTTIPILLVHFMFIPLESMRRKSSDINYCHFIWFPFQFQCYSSIYVILDVEVLHTQKNVDTKCDKIVLCRYICECYSLEQTPLGLRKFTLVYSLICLLWNRTFLVFYNLILLRTWSIKHSSFITPANCQPRRRRRSVPIFTRFHQHVPCQPTTDICMQISSKW